MADPWGCICEFLRAQTAQLANVIQTLGNQNTISDMNTADNASLPSTGGIALSPMSIFTFALLLIWGYLYLNRNKMTDKKPRPSSATGRDENPRDDEELF